MLGLRRNCHRLLSAALFYLFSLIFYLFQESDYSLCFFPDCAESSTRVLQQYDYNYLFQRNSSYASAPYWILREMLLVPTTSRHGLLSTAGTSVLHAHKPAAISPSRGFAHSH